jgi:hypothetical protein
LFPSQGSTYVTFHIAYSLEYQTQMCHNIFHNSSVNTIDASMYP